MSEILPNMGVRFIAIGDNVDSADGNLDYDLMVPIKNVFKNTYPSGRVNHTFTQSSQ